MDADSLHPDDALEGDTVEGRVSVHSFQGVADASVHSNRSHVGASVHSNRSHMPYRIPSLIGGGSSVGSVIGTGNYFDETAQ